MTLSTKKTLAAPRRHILSPAIHAISPWGALFCAFLCGLFGANAVAIKFSLQGMGPFSVAAIRFGMASLILLGWARLTRQSWRVQKAQLPKLMIIVGIFFIQLSLFYVGINHTYASRGALLANMQPFYVLFLAHFFVPGDQITKRKLLGILLAFSGVALVFLGRQETTASLRFGDAVMLLAAFVWACNGVYTKRILTDIKPLQVVLFPTLFSAPLFLIAAVMTGELSAVRLHPKVILALLYQVVVVTAFGFVAWNTMLRQYGAVALHSFIFIMPVTGVLLGGLVLGEPVTVTLFIALLLIVSGILVVNARVKKELPIVHPGRNI
jgi:drug/metabolite transporter (DMT)-like permease